MTLRETRTLNISREYVLYNELKARGYTVLWVGDGKICLQAPEVQRSEAEVNAILKAGAITEVRE